MLYKEFRANVRHDYKIDGAVTIYRAARDRATGHLVAGLEITEDEFALRENEHILIVYDEKIPVVPGGLGTGADIVANGDGAGRAEGGYGTGGKIDAKGKAKGGSGAGGDGYGVKSGTAGKGVGADAKPLPNGDTAAGGSGVGGEVTPAPYRKKEKSAES